MTDDYKLTPEQWAKLKADADTPEGVGEMFEVACNADPDTDFLQARRVGIAGSKLDARVGVHVQHSPKMFGTIYISAPEARQLAAHLLNAADEIDGTVPLVFFPRLPNGDEAPEAEEPTAATAAGTALADFAAVTGDTGATGHSYTGGERVQVLSLWVTSEGLPVANCRSLLRPALFQVVAQADLDTVSFLAEDGE